MAVAAFSCSLVSGGCLKVPFVSAISGAVSRSSGSSLAFDPLYRRHTRLRSSSRSAYLSSSLAPSTSFALNRKFTETHESSRLRLAAPRASSKDEEETEHMTKISKNESEDRLLTNEDKSSESSQNPWSQFLTSAAKPAVVAVMMALLLAQPVEDSFAASSGGRMGGKSFSAPSRPSAPSRSYSGGGGGGRAYSGGGGGLYGAPPIYGSPYGYSPFGYSPFYGGGYGGGLFLGPSIGFGGGGTIILAMIAFATVRAVVGFIRDRFSGDDDDRFDD